MSELLIAQLLTLNYTQSLVDLCLWFNDDVICAICVNDTILLSPDNTKISQTNSEMKQWLCISTYVGRDNH